jgi:hypothetical protein
VLETRTGRAKAIFGRLRLQQGDFRGRLELCTQFKEFLFAFGQKLTQPMHSLVQGTVNTPIDPGTQQIPQVPPGKTINFLGKSDEAQSL